MNERGRWSLDHLFLDRLLTAADAVGRPFPADDFLAWSAGFAECVERVAWCCYPLRSRSVF